MIVLIISQIPVSFFVSGLGNTAAIIKNNLLTADGPEKMNELASLMLGISTYSKIIEEIDWGIWLIPFAMLVYAADFIPRIFGTILIIGGTTWIIYCVSFFLFPQYHDLISMIAIPCGIIAEILFTLWFLIKGINEPDIKKIEMKA